MAMVLAETIQWRHGSEGGDLGQRPVAGDAQGRRRRDLHHARRAGRFARAAPAVLLAGTRPTRRLVPGRSRDPRPGEVPPPRPAQPELAVPTDFPIIFCRNVSIYFAEDERMTLLNRLAQHLRPGGWLAMGNGEILPEVPPSLRKHSPSLFQKEG